jgi:hypothetical protein
VSVDKSPSCPSAVAAVEGANSEAVRAEAARLSLHRGHDLHQKQSARVKRSSFPTTAPGVETT